LPDGLTFALFLLALCFLRRFIEKNQGIFAHLQFQSLGRNKVKGMGANKKQEQS
jgi:hypothetical protein